MNVFDGVGAFGIVFGLIGLGFALIAIIIGVKVVQRTRSTDAALRRGLTAEGQVLDVYQATQGSHDHHYSTRHAVIGFRASDGHEYRIDDASGQPRVVGDHVTVRYLPGSPQQGVPADVRGPVSGGLGVGTAVVLIFLGIFAVTGLFFAVVGIGISVFGFSFDGTPSNLPTDFPTPGQ